MRTRDALAFRLPRRYPDGGMNDVTELLNAVARGEAQAADRLLPLVYDELRRLAAQYLDREQAGQTLQPTALVHEAYLRLVGTQNAAQAERWNGRSHFVAAAALAMRHILTDNARRKQREKYGGDRQRIQLTEAAAASRDENEHLLALDEALTGLAATDPVAAELVQLHTFGGLSIEDAGRHLGLSRSAAYREWSFARAWLRCELGEKKSP